MQKVLTAFRDYKTRTVGGEKSFSEIIDAD